MTEEDLEKFIRVVENGGTVFAHTSVAKAFEGILEVTSIPSPFLMETQVVAIAHPRACVYGGAYG